MEEEMVMSMVSNTIMAEASDSNSNSNNCQPNKRQKHDHSASSLTRFKGVVLQQNGHWGAQIYVNHQRIWLGTFSSEKEAAMAYDSAALKLRSGDSFRNFPLTNVTIQEPKFQDLYKTEVILSMIKDRSYNSKFMEFLRNQSHKMEDKVELNLGNGGLMDRGFVYHQLFQKELTPSDVGKLNRLVIPKKHAVKYFPQLSEGKEGEDEDGENVDDLQLTFFDRQMKSWKFRYCYWKSSQSYVFTRGWNRFVKEKELKAKDVVTFYKCEHRHGFKEQQAFCMIVVGYNASENINNGSVGEFNGYFRQNVDLQLGFGGSLVRDRKQMEEEQNVVISLAQQVVEEKSKGFRLFGVQIS
ncbi:AP2/ERF and B3 domain-containing transcription factor [Thalictrum thalictroides]|uniref:AP2/ERF and B3 domain-containing transcription factor n=1 Tax=Thalictrum thalictroides TaxID=46969 RepID=A0A7J6WML4_THATH|nr:AP2/ERF and B3 domain-containing transcription factor [Thalictrum thalictroides]